eukprot:922610_1
MSQCYLDFILLTMQNGRLFSCLPFNYGIFYSDIILTIEIWNTEIDLDEQHHMWLFVSAVGSTFFLVVPYIANLAYAARIKRRVNSNTFAREYFNGNTTLFSMAVVFTGGCYPALALVSSRL